MHILGAYMHIHIKYSKSYLSLILWLGGLCTDADNADDANTDTDANANKTNNYA